MIVLLAGLPGTGKSTLALGLAERLNAAILSKDAIRHALFAPPDVEYSTSQDDLVLRIMLEAATWLLRKHPARILFLDGRTFSRRYQIDLVLKAAQEPITFPKTVIDTDQPLDICLQRALAVLR